MAASLTRLARSAPQNPGCPGPRHRGRRREPGACLRTCTARMAARSAWLGSGISTWRSKRPGRSRAGSSVSGRLVAAMTTTPVAGSKPSISASSWLRVCSRSSLETSAPPRRWPMASISSMKMMDGARLRASANRSRTRDAPTPTNISTKLDPVRARNGTLRLAGHRPGHAGSCRCPAGPTISTPRGPMAPAACVALGVLEEVDHLAISRLAPS